MNCLEGRHFKLNALNLSAEQVLKLNFLNTVPTAISYETAEPYNDR